MLYACIAYTVVGRKDSRAASKGTLWNNRFQPGRAARAGRTMRRD